jgi:hypothetical protein
MLSVTHAQYVKPKTLRVTFNNQEEYLINFADTIKKDHRIIWQQLSDDQLFKKFSIDHDTVCWSNGLDVAPEYLYFLANKNNPALKEQFIEWGYWS